jgi:hypothetical protein
MSMMFQSAVAALVAGHIHMQSIEACPMPMLASPTLPSDCWSTATVLVVRDSRSRRPLIMLYFIIACSGDEKNGKDEDDDEA